MAPLEVQQARALAAGWLQARYYLRPEAVRRSRVEPRSVRLSSARRWPVR
jgi:hypothetical protein